MTDEWADTLRMRSARPGSVDVVMNTGDIRIFNRQAIGRAEPKEDRFDVVYHGTFTHRYGVDTLIEALSRLVESVPEIHLTLLGDGETRVDLEAQVRRLDLEDRVEFSDGLVSAEALPARLGSADVGVVPNRANIFTNGILPTKLLEYVALGIPAIVADTAGVRRYFGSHAVEFFEPGDSEGLAEAIERLYHDPKRRAQLAERADRFNLEHSWTEGAASYVETDHRLDRWRRRLATRSDRFVRAILSRRTG